MGRPTKQDFDKETIRTVTRISHRVLESVWGNDTKKLKNALKAVANGKAAKVKPKKESKE